MLLPARTFEGLPANRLPARLAVSAACFTLAAGVLALLAGLPPVIIVFGLSGLVLAFVYLGSARAIGKKIELARHTLRAARKGRFENLANLPQTPERDELDALIRQVYRISRALQEEIERLESLENYRRDFLGDVSHELKTPIFAVSGFAESLLDGALEDPTVNRVFLEKILRNAKRLNSLASDLTEISRLEAGELDLLADRVNLASLLQDTKEGTEVLAEERRVSVSVSADESLPPVYADPERIRQVVKNLVENAIRYNRPGGRVEVTARLNASGSVRVAILDNGVGIPQDALPRITERFFRVDKSRSREQGGTGLGLAIVKHVLEAHDTRLHVESEVGVGSSFSFSLPPFSDEP